MARTVRDNSLETRAARLRLQTRGKPYWRSIETGLHVGYRRLRNGGGTWVARRFIGGGRYSETSFGVADDMQEADGVSVLSFRQCQDAARSWWKLERRRALGLEEERGGPYTVAEALADYTQDYLRRGGRDLTNLRSIVKVHILPALGSLDAAKLTTKRIRDWHHGLANSAKLVRTGEGGAGRTFGEHNINDSDAVRRRRARANRILTVLKAALNHAYAERRIETDDAWRRVEPFRDVDRPSVRYLTGAECQRLINASDAHFRQLVRAAIFTGARYGELTRLRVADVELAARTIHVRESKSGKPRHVPLTDEALQLFRGLVIGRAGQDFVFLRLNGRGWKKSEQARPLAAACERARLDPPITFHGLRDTFASMLAMNGAPMAVIANLLGHSDTRITEKHYAHLAPNYVAEILRTHFPRVTNLDEGNLYPIAAE